MQYPESWLRSICNPPISTRAQLADRLTMAGLEVEASAPVGAAVFSGVVVGEIAVRREASRTPTSCACAPCTPARARLLQIVCGAPNVARRHERAAARKVGRQASRRHARSEVGEAARRGKPRHARARRASWGCPSDHAGLLELPPKREARCGCAQQCWGSTSDDHAQAHPQPRRLPVDPGRGARSVGADWNAIEAPEIPPVPAERRGDTLPVRIAAPEGCGRFAGRVIRNVNAKAPTPQWMRERLERAASAASRRWWTSPTT